MEEHVNEVTEVARVYVERRNFVRGPGANVNVVGRDKYGNEFDLDFQLDIFNDTPIGYAKLIRRVHGLLDAVLVSRDAISTISFV